MPRLCLLALVVALLVAAFPAAAAGPHGAVIAWGCDFGDFGQCAVPPAAGSGATAIAASNFLSLALTKDGAVIAWGCGGGRDVGQCSVPAAAGSGVTAIAAGPYHGLALKNGGVIAWGCGGFINWGQCSVPGAAASGVKAIAAGFTHSLALRQDGSVVAWGCGIDNVGQCTVPAAAQSGVTAISAGLYHSLALRQDGGVVAWGCAGGTSSIPPQPSDYGQCGVPPAATSGVKAIAAGYYQSLAVKQDGSVVAWGCGSNGGFNLDFGQCAVPAGATSGVTAVAAGESHSLALKDGAVLVFGCSAGSTSPRCNVPPAAGSGVTAIAAGGHSLALSDPLDQTIAVTAHAPAAAAFQQTFTVAASSTSGLPVTFSSGGACSNAGATFTITSGARTCEVRYDQPGGGRYGAAPRVVESVAARKAEQTIAFAPLPRRTFGDPDFRVAARASSGLPVAFAARGKCRVRGSRVHLTGAGSCTVTASQAGDENYAAAPPVSRRFPIARPPCTVPKVVGKPVASARRVIARRHCRTGRVSYAFSPRRKGVVVAQSRRPGQVLPPASRIDLVVSRGRKP